MNNPITVYPANYQYSWKDVTPQGAWVEDMIPSSGSVLLFGPAGVGKTTFACNMLNAIALQQQFLGRNTFPTPSLFLSLDTPSNEIKRRWIGNKPDFKPSFQFAPYESFNCLDPMFLNSQLYAQLADKVREKRNEADEIIQPKTQLVIVDSLRDVFNGEMINDDIPKYVYGIFQRWFDNAAVVFLHHTRKAQIHNGKTVDTNIDDEATGSKYWINKAQVSLHLGKVTEKILKIQMGKSQCFASWNNPLKMEIDGAYISDWGKAKAAQYATTYSTASTFLQSTDPQWGNYTEQEKDEVIAIHLKASVRTVRTMKAAYRKMIP